MNKLNISNNNISNINFSQNLVVNIENFLSKLNLSNYLI